MIKGIGTDIIEINRIKEAIDKNDKFISKILSEREIEYVTSRGNRIESIAGRFAAKEAVSKALGTGFRGFSFLDIEILNDNLGKPRVELSEKIKTLFNIQEDNINISISHNRKDAIAFVVIEE